MRKRAINQNKSKADITFRTTYKGQRNIKNNKIIENNEISFKENEKLEFDNKKTEICKDEALWQEIDMITLEPDQDSGGSDSDCSLEFVNDTAENNTKTENPDKFIKIKKKSADCQQYLLLSL